jgi:hypothetical protein
LLQLLQKWCLRIYSSGITDPEAQGYENTFSFHRMVRAALLLLAYGPRCAHLAADPLAPLASFPPAGHLF